MDQNNTPSTGKNYSHIYTKWLVHTKALYLCLPAAQGPKTHQVARLYSGTDYMVIFKGPNLETIFETSFSIFICILSMKCILTKGKF